MKHIQELSKRYKVSKYGVLWIVIDAVLLSVAFIMAFLLRYNVDFYSEQAEILKAFILPVILLKLTIYYLSGLYRVMWRYASTTNFFNIALVNVLGSLVVVLLFFFLFQISMARGVVALDGLLSLALTGGARFIIRGVRELRYKNIWINNPSLVLIAGAGYTGAAVIREMRNRPDLGLQPVGLLDDSKDKQGMNVHGVSVLGTRKDLRKVLQQYNVEEVIICMPSASRQVIRDIFFQCQKANVKCRTVPGVYQLINKTVRIEQVRNIDVEDIMGREPVSVDLKRMSEYITGKHIMITGAGGSIGSELCRQIKHIRPASLILLDQSESELYKIEQELKQCNPPFPIVPIIADITNRVRIDSVFPEYKPGVVFHSAAYKHVPLMEPNLIEAVNNNIFGTKNLCEIAMQTGVERFIFISTDKSVEPASIMGLSKAICEKVVQFYAESGKTRFMSVRFGNVLDSSGSVVPIFRKQIAQGGPITVTDPAMRRYFMTMPESVQLIIQAGAWGECGDIYILDMGEQIFIVDLAKNMIQIAGLEPETDIPIVFTGIRPGEKIYEKLYWDYEKVHTTDHNKILLVSSTSLNRVKLDKDIRKLEASMRTGDVLVIKNLLYQMCADHFHYKLT
jgi:FlaA1/EpsC-like NDP-sugar epimerase